MSSLGFYDLSSIGSSYTSRIASKNLRIVAMQATILSVYFEKVNVLYLRKRHGDSNILHSCIETMRRQQACLMTNACCRSIGYGLIHGLDVEGHS